MNFSLTLSTRLFETIFYNELDFFLIFMSLSSDINENNKIKHFRVKLFNKNNITNKNFTASLFYSGFLIII